MVHTVQYAKNNWFLGRMYNPLTQCYEFSDNNGCPITAEVAEKH